MNNHLWGSATWWQGIGAGLVLAMVWHAEKNITRILGAAGICFLFLVAIGLGSDLSDQSRAFFNGMSLAMPIGYALAAWWRWNKLRPKLVYAARHEKQTWLLKLLGEKE
jgi:peptidoglycan/LPS O-acetylase OafA/YrhL